MSRSRRLPELFCMTSTPLLCNSPEPMSQCLRSKVERPASWSSAFKTLAMQFPCVWAPAMWGPVSRLKRPCLPSNRSTMLHHMLALDHLTYPGPGAEQGAHSHAPVCSSQSRSVLTVPYRAMSLQRSTAVQVVASTCPHFSIRAPTQLPACSCLALLHWDW